MARKIPDPVPLKHHTETAYLLFLGVIIAIFGFLIALLPALPAGWPYWSVLAAVSLIYPLVLLPTFRDNRADYEFRLMHWFPAGMVALWLLLQFLAPKFRLAYIFQLGFFFLWSLPLVVLGIVFMIIFALHVIRRRETRIALLGILLAFFTIGSVLAEARGWNTRLQAALFPEKPNVTLALQNAWKSTTAFLGFGGQTPSSGSTIAMQGSSSSAVRSSSSSSVAIAAVSSSASSVSSSRAPIASKPNHLPASGPGDVAAVLAATLLGLYAATVHVRARNRELV